MDSTAAGSVMERLARQAEEVAGTAPASRQEFPEALRRRVEERAATVAAGGMGRSARALGVEP